MFLPQAISWHSTILNRMRFLECSIDTNKAYRIYKSYVQSSPSHWCSKQIRVMSYESRLAIDRYTNVHAHRTRIYAQFYHREQNIWWWNINNDIIERCDKYSMALDLFVYTQTYKHCCRFKCANGFYHHRYHHHHHRHRHQSNYAYNYDYHYSIRIITRQ